MSLRNLENQIGQLATVLSKRPQGNLPSNTEDPRRDEKKPCKVINLRSRKDVHILVGLLKRIVELISTEEETQIEEEPQQPIFKYISESSQAAAIAKQNMIQCM